MIPPALESPITVNVPSAPRLPREVRDTERPPGAKRQQLTDDRSNEEENAA